MLKLDGGQTQQTKDVPGMLGGLVWIKPQMLAERCPCLLRMSSVQFYCSPQCSVSLCWLGHRIWWNTSSIIIQTKWVCQLPFQASPLLVVVFLHGRGSAQWAMWKMTWTVSSFLTVHIKKRLQIGWGLHFLIEHRLQVCNRTYIWGHGSGVGREPLWPKSRAMHISHETCKF